ncbi:MAG: hypothetical protein H0Z24_02300 [Thermosipho sp. (in: Bacteria)]|nr:hypothetical protein [Thermosipho sp. (in: thermotogales)]
MRKIIIIFAIMLMFISGFSIKKDVIFQDTDIRDALSQLSMMYDVPIIFPNDISGNVNIILYDVSIETALKLILSPFDLSFERLDDVIVIFSESSFSYFVPHVYKPKNRSAEAIVSVLEKLPVYAVGDNVIVYCPDSLWPEYLERLKEVDVKESNLVVSYVVYYIKDTDLKKYNLDPNKLLDLLPVFERARYVLSTNGFFVGKEVKLKVNGDISLVAESNFGKLKFSFKTYRETVSYEIPFSKGSYKNILYGSFGRFVVLINIDEIKSVSQERKADINYVPDKLVGVKYYSSNDFEIYINDKNIGAFILKQENIFIGANLNLIDNFSLGVMVELENATNLIIIAEDKYYFDQVFIKLKGSFPIDLSNLSNFDGQYIVDNLKFGLGIGTSYAINRNILLNGMIFVNNDLLVSGEIGVRYLNYGIGLYLDSLLKFGLTLEFRW